MTKPNLALLATSMAVLAVLSTTPVSAATLNAQLENAADHSNIAAVKRLVQAGADVRASDALGEATYRPAAQENDGPPSRELIAYLLDHGADPNRVTRYRTTALINIMGWDHFDPKVADMLLRHGAKVNLGVDGETALMAASTAVMDAGEVMQDASIDGARWLIAHGAKVNAGYPGETALTYAADSDSAEVVGLLIANGAKIDGYRGDLASNPLLVATDTTDDEAFGFRYHAAMALIRHGANVNVHGKLG